MTRILALFLWLGPLAARARPAEADGPGACAPGEACGQVATLVGWR